MSKPETESVDIKAIIAEQVALALSGDKLAKIVNAQLKDLKETVESLKTKEVEKEKAPAEEPVKKETGLTKTEVALKKLKAQLESETAARKEAENQRNMDRMLNAARKAAVDAGVPANRVDDVLAVLHSQQGKIKMDKEGRPVILLKKEWGDEEVEIGSGLKEWVKGPGERFLPPKEVQSGPSKPTETYRLENTENGGSMLNMDKLREAVIRNL